MSAPLARGGKPARRWSPRSVLGLALLGAACAARPAPETPSEGRPATAPANTPSVVSSAIAPSRSIEPTTAVTSVPAASHPSHASTPVDGCQRDDDCVVDFTTTEGPFTCCNGCVARAVSKAALGVFRGKCAQKPPEMCPPLGCASAPLHAACEAARCVLRPR